MQPAAHPEKTVGDDRELPPCSGASGRDQITGNVRGFARVAGLTVESWAAEP
jgi:hypothetical protein